ncbi:MAG: hypothetical protein REH83_02380 [Rickettsiella sp.]|nr:hypothetical protein [Rickettsiella sp.]
MPKIKTRNCRLVDTDVTQELIPRLRSSTHAYFITKTINFSIYRQETLAAIKTSRVILEKHRGYKKILGNLLFIFTLGSGFLVNKACTGKLLISRQTETSKPLEERNQRINDALISLFINFSWGFI